MKSAGSSSSKIDAQDILAMLGILLLGAGLAITSISLALSVVGGLMFLCAVWPDVAPRSK